MARSVTVIPPKQNMQTEARKQSIKKLRVAAYCRVSSDKEEQLSSYENQVRYYTNFINSKDEYEFVGIYADEGITGTSTKKRDEFNRMIESLGEKDLVCFTETSRFGRNYIDCFDMLDILTQQKKCTVKFLSNGIELEGGEKMNPYTWMTVSQFFIQDEFLKRQIGYNTSNALQRKKEQGVVLGRPCTISLEQREEIKELRKSHTCREIAEMYGVDASTISRIK